MHTTYEIAKADLEYRAARAREEFHPTPRPRSARLLRTRRTHREERVS